MEHLIQGNQASPAITFGVRVAQTNPIDWLKLGLRDMMRSPAPNLGYGLLFFAMGYVILALTAGRPYLFLGAVSGFFLIAPLLLAGVFQLAREQGKGQTIGFQESLTSLRGNGQSLADFGLVLVFVTLCWQMLSALLFAFNYSGVSQHGNVVALANSLFISGASLSFLTSYLVLGGVIAAFVFAISAVTVPMLLDRKVDVVTAMITSVAAVRSNPKTLLVWAALIVALVGIGFATAMIGLIVIVPLLGHASWHAYKDLVE